MDMQLKIDEYGTIIDERTNDTLLVNGVAFPCSAANTAAIANAKHIVMCVNLHPHLLKKAEMADALLKICEDLLKQRAEMNSELSKIIKLAQTGDE